MKRNALERNIASLNYWKHRKEHQRTVLRKVKRIEKVILPVRGLRICGARGWIEAECSGQWLIR